MAKIQKEKMKPTLYIVATPIGNLGDLSPRAINTLKEVDIIASEDTRHTKKLLMHFEIKTPSISFHAGSNPEKIINLLKEGKSIALVSDAGTPAISDPGVKLVSEAVKNGFLVSPIPGPSAFVSALSASGFPTNHFEFLGYFPHKKGREKILKGVSEKDHTIVFYESTHRILKFLKQASEIIPDRRIMLARELTKIYEEFLHGTPSEILEILEETPEKQKGEFTVVIGPKSFK